MLPQREFINDDFLLGSEVARELYQTHASRLPIIDFHNHLSIELIAKNHQFGDLEELWLSGDHYKWRAMRANGIAEHLCTGRSRPQERLRAWIETVPFALRNPLYIWSHLELKRAFGWNKPVAPEHADEIWRCASEQLPELRVHDLLARFNVALLATTDDPADSLAAHQAMRNSGCKTKVVPTFRPDVALAVDQPSKWNEWLERLGAIVGAPVRTLDDLMIALKSRHDTSTQWGVVHQTTDWIAYPHAQVRGRAQLRYSPPAVEAGRHCPRSRRSTQIISCARWHAGMLRREWVRQYHLGAARSVNTASALSIGVGVGFDSIGGPQDLRVIARHLDALERSHALPRMVHYNSNPADNYAFAALAASFPGEGSPCKVQLGPA